MGVASFFQGVGGMSIPVYTRQTCCVVSQWKTCRGQPRLQIISVRRERILLID